MARNSASSKKRKSIHKNEGFVKKDASFLTKLNLLRNFVPESEFEEADLSSCLRQCAYNVELAAERLMTGQYKASPKNGIKNNFFSSANSSSSSSAAAASASSVPTTSVPAAKKKRTIPSSSADREASKNSDTIILDDGGQGQHLLLCQRWLVGLSTSKHGGVNHKEALSLTSSTSGPPMVRFRGRSIEGTLPTNLCAMLSPLLRFELTLVSMKCEALMEDRGVPIGGEVPISLSIFIEDPEAFFGLFESETCSHNSSSADLFFNSSKASKGKRRSQLRLPIAEAAFGLLQWAEYGDVPHFEPPKKSENESDSIGSKGVEDTEDSDEDAVLEEDQFDKEAAAGSKEDEPPVPEWARKVVDPSLSGSNDSPSLLPEASDPVGLKNGVVLRPYQKQALHWMMQRESDKENREELENELELLSELASKSLKRSPSLPSHTIADGIACECGPVLVSESSARRSTTVAGQPDPVNHPLWRRRFLAKEGMRDAISFYVNELLGVASGSAPNPPKQCVGGILSDSMGLGKTVMLMSLILKSKEFAAVATNSDDTNGGCQVEESDASPEQGATLVVAPLSLVAQWEEELATKTTLSHCVHYGDSVCNGIPSGVDVVVTTYGMVQGELASRKGGNGKSTRQGLLLHTWNRVILDEAHCIKNPNTLVSKACCALNATKRWCVTGTPIQNSLQDVYGLLKFLRHEPWCEGGFWKAAISSMAKELEPQPEAGRDASSHETSVIQPERSAGLKIAVDRVRRLLAPIILRRTKDTLNKDGKPILTLPPVDSKTVVVTLSSAERDFYNSLLEKSQSVFEGFVKSGTATKSWFAIFSLLQRLRQACDHVALTVKPQIDQSEFSQPPGSSVAKSSSRSPDAAAKPTVDAVNGEFLESLLEKFHTTQSANKTTDPSRDKENCTSSAYTSKVAHALSKTIHSNADTVEEECPICLDRPLINDAVITPCAHIFCRDCLVGVLRNRSSPTERTTTSDTRKAAIMVSCPDGECPCCNSSIRASRIVAMSKSSHDGRTTTTYLISDNSNPSILQVKKEARAPANGGARQALEDALRGAESSKLNAVINELHAIWRGDHRSKVIIFSQFLGFLNLLEASLQKNNIPFNRLDGKMNLKQRIAALEEFNTISNPHSRDGKSSSNIGSVLLVSMKAGGVGLNLVAASSVFIIDPWWNEAVEDQCVNRVHRIGQTAEVVRVRKFVVSDSVEERIVALQKRKKSMASDILSDVRQEADELENSQQPTLDDFKILFGRETS